MISKDIGAGIALVLIGGLALAWLELSLRRRLRG